MRPICINHGCNNGVATMAGRVHDNDPRWRVHCTHCQAASYGKWPHRTGVTPFKTGKCSNTDGHLGFDCMIKWSKVPNWAKGMTEVDHIDGDRTNNHPTNFDELCPICHKLKGQQSGDFDKTKRHGIQLSTGYKGKKAKNALFQFENFFAL